MHTDKQLAGLAGRVATLDKQIKGIKSTTVPRSIAWTDKEYSQRLAAANKESNTRKVLSQLERGIAKSRMDSRVATLGKGMAVKALAGASALGLMAHGHNVGVDSLSQRDADDIRMEKVMAHNRGDSGVAGLATRAGVSALGGYVTAAMLPRVMGVPNPGQMTKELAKVMVPMGAATGALQYWNARLGNDK